MPPPPAPDYSIPEDWRTARGLYTIDYNNLILLARTRVEDLAGALARDASLWQQDVLHRPVVLQPNAILVFRLAGHAWSIVLDNPHARTPYGLIGYAWEKALSRRLGQPLIEYAVSDTCGSIGYILFSDGEILEDLFYESGPDNGPDPVKSHFQSTRRDLTLKQINNPWDFTWQFFYEHDAFDPGFEFAHFFDHHPPQPGATAVVRNPWFLNVELPDLRHRRHSPELERVDYLVLK